MHLFLRVTAYDPQNITDIGTIHTQNKIIFFIIFFGKLHSIFTRRTDMILRQFFTCSLMHRITYFFPACTCRCNHKPVRKPFFFDHVLQQKFCHWRTTDITVTNKHDTMSSFHKTSSSSAKQCNKNNILTLSYQ